MEDIGIISLLIVRILLLHLRLCIEHVILLRRIIGILLFHLWHKGGLLRLLSEIHLLELVLSILKGLLLRHKRLIILAHLLAI